MRTIQSPPPQRYMKNGKRAETRLRILNGATSFPDGPLSHVSVGH